VNVGTAVHLTDAPVGSDAWHEARRTRMNGSEIAAVLGLSPYESPFSLWHRKAGTVGGVATTDVMYWGTTLEPVIRAEWNKRHPDLAVAETGQWQHKDRPWQGGSPDGLGDGRLWEAKTAHLFLADQWGEPGTDEIPIQYRCQTLWYLDVFGFEYCDVSVLIGGSDYREYVIRRDDAELAVMRAKALEFLATLEAELPPRIDGHEATYEAVKALHPDIDPTAVDLDPAVAVPYLDALVEHAAATEAKRRTSALVIDAMGSAKDAYYAGRRIASRQAKKSDGSTPYLVAAKGAVGHHREEAAA
jgi:putative phage-type endonuclease